MAVPISKHTAFWQRLKYRRTCSLEFNRIDRGASKVSGNKYRVTDGCKETGMWKKKCSEGYVVVTARQKYAFIEFQVTYCYGSVLSDEEMPWR